jgi:hypothetical protein
VKGIRKEIDRDLIDGTGSRLSGKIRTVSIRTGSLAGLAIGVAITVDGVASKVIDEPQVGSGAITRIRYREVVT